MRRPKLPTDETALIRLAASCDDRAFCALMERFRSGMMQILSRYADNREDREDLHGEVVVKFLREGKQVLKAWEPRAPFSAYVWTVTARHCVQWARRRSRLGAAFVAALPGVAEEGLGYWETAADPDGAGDPPLAVQTQELKGAVVEALGRLPAEDRLILLLRFEQGMNGPVIGRTLGISHGAARKRLFTSLRRLTRELGCVAPWVFGEDDGGAGGNSSGGQ